MQVGGSGLDIGKKDFTNLWEWFGKDTMIPQFPKVALKPVALDVWRPRLCHLKGPLYVFEGEDATPPSGKEVEDPTTAVGAPAPHAPRQRVKLCVICRRPPVDPVTFDCGHKFCRVCIAKIRPMLLQDFAESIKDIRTQIQCPFPSCHHLMPCRPLVNGDFRFHDIHPEDKVQILTVSPSEIKALKSFRVSIDIDFTKKCKSELFGRYNDV